MSRSGYVDDDHNGTRNLYRANVDRSLAGVRGQAFLRELATALDAMPEKELITDELVNEEGDCCTLGAVCLARGMDVSKIDYECPQSVGKAMGISSCMAAEIEYENDEHDQWAWDEEKRTHRRMDETPAQRWTRMRKWVQSKLLDRR